MLVYWSLSEFLLTSPGFPSFVSLWCCCCPFTKVFCSLSAYGCSLASQTYMQQARGHFLLGGTSSPLYAALNSSSLYSAHQRTLSVFTALMNINTSFQLLSHEPGCYPGLLLLTLPTAFDWSDSFQVYSYDLSRFDLMVFIPVPLCRPLAVLSQISSSISNWFPYFHFHCAPKAQSILPLLWWEYLWNTIQIVLILCIEHFCSPQSQNKLQRDTWGPLWLIASSVLPCTPALPNDPLHSLCSPCLCAGCFLFLEATVTSFTYFIFPLQDSKPSLWEVISVFFFSLPASGLVSLYVFPQPHCLSASPGWLWTS